MSVSFFIPRNRFIIEKYLESRDIQLNIMAKGLELTAACNWLSSTCVYISVVAILSCPRSCCKDRMSTRPYLYINVCPYQKNGKCDGEICKSSELPPIKLDNDKNIIEGCTFEIVLNIIGTSIREIEISPIKIRYGLDYISDIAKKINNQ